MNHVAVEQFWKCYDKLPVSLQKLTDGNFSVMKQYPNHPLLRLLKIDNVVSLRIGSRVRALACDNGTTFIWFWIGTYKQYKLLVDSSKNISDKKK